MYWLWLHAGCLAYRDSWYAGRDHHCDIRALNHLPVAPHPSMVQLSQYGTTTQPCPHEVLRPSLVQLSKYGTTSQPQPRAVRFPSNGDIWKQTNKVNPKLYIYKHDESHL